MFFFLKILEPRYLSPIPTNMQGARIFRKKNVITLDVNIHYIQGLRNGFHLGVAHSNKDFEKVDFQKYL